MDWAITTTSWLLRASRRVWKRKWSFLTLTLLIFLFLLAVLALSGLLPDAPKKQSVVQSGADVTLATAPVSRTTLTTSRPLVSVTELPIKIEIPAIRLSVSVSNPNTTNIKLLDKALFSGAVRYPLSAQLGERGNVIIFGHSSYLPFISHVYKTFDGIQKLKRGDRIIVSAHKLMYVYYVDSVSKKNARVDAISLAVKGRELTLATCDSFAAKSSRFIVTAHFVDSYPVEK